MMLENIILNIILNNDEMEVLSIHVCERCEEEYDLEQSDAVDKENYCSEICEIDKIEEDLK